jgi:diguanylate cyclase (GGDEF)-like protein
MTAVATPRGYTEGATAPPLWAKPDPALAAAGIEGELVVARVRVVAMALLMIAPTWNIIHRHDEPMFVTGFIITLTAALASLAFWILLRRGRWRPWVGFATSAFDVSMVSLALVTFLVVASPMIALNSKVTFEMYFLAIIATSLRYDARICIAIGLLAVAEYAAMWIYAGAKFDLRDPRWIAEAGPYSAVDLGTRLILLFIATILAITIVRRAQRLLYLASRDRLTGLFNRGHFDRTLVGSMESAARDEQPLSLALLDIDHFKQVNDTHGHAVGDRVLVQVADLLARAMRRTDMVARYGGEEFVILMPGTSRDDALTAVEELRKEIAASPIRLSDEEVLNLNFSAGIAGIPTDTSVVTPKELLTRADDRLLAAKRAGRARCIGADLT